MRCTDPKLMADVKPEPEHQPGVVDRVQHGLLDRRLVELERAVVGVRDVGMGLGHARHEEAPLQVPPRHLGGHVGEAGGRPGAPDGAALHPHGAVGDHLVAGAVEQAGVGQEQLVDGWVRAHGASSYDVDPARARPGRDRRGNEPEQPLGVAAQTLDERLGRLAVGRVPAAEVGAEDQPLGADHGDKGLPRLVAVDVGVEPQALQRPAEAAVAQAVGDPRAAWPRPARTARPGTASLPHRGRRRRRGRDGGRARRRTRGRPPPASRRRRSPPAGSRSKRWSRRSGGGPSPPDDAGWRNSGTSSSTRAR